MKHTITITVPAKQQVVVDKVTCDICSKVIKDGYGNVDEVTIEHKKGYQHSDGGAGDTKRFDVCGNCFTGFLVPFFKKLGVEPQVENWDY